MAKEVTGVKEMRRKYMEEKWVWRESEMWEAWNMGNVLISYQECHEIEHVASKVSIKTAERHILFPHLTLWKQSGPKWCCLWKVLYIYFFHAEGLCCCLELVDFSCFSLPARQSSPSSVWSPQPKQQQNTSLSPDSHFLKGTHGHQPKGLRKHSKTKQHDTDNDK